MKRRQKVCVLLSIVLFLFHVVRNAPGVLILFMHDVFGESASIMAKATFIASFYRGYVLTQLPGAFVAHKSGGKMVLWYSIMGCGLAMLSAPFVATGPALSACMAVVGLCQGPLLPAKAELLARWVPPNELAEMLAVTRLGDIASKVAAGPVLGVLASWVGWRASMFVLGAALLLLGWAWRREVASSPAQCPPHLIDHEERTLLAQECVGRVKQNIRDRLGSNEQAVAWCRTAGLLVCRGGAASTGLWAVVLAHWSHNLGSFILKDWGATYYLERFALSKRGAAVLLAMPYAAATGFQLVTKRWPRLAVEAGWCTQDQCRRACSTIAFAGSAAALIQWAWARTATTALVAHSVVASVSTLHAAGYVAMYLDIGKGDAAIVYAVGNTLASFAGLAAPHFAGWALSQASSRSTDRLDNSFGASAWAALFDAVAAACLLGSID
eukprot:g82.t1